MADIKYVCLSDTHLGEEDGLFTNLKVGRSEPEPGEPSPVLVELATCLKAVLEKNEKTKPTLILNGDLLELALADTNQAAMAFERFFECMMIENGRLFDRIIYLPGNHDHHNWEVARESQYVDYIKRTNPGEFLNEPWHATNTFVENDPNLAPAYLLTNLIRRYPSFNDFTVATAYPNFGVVNNDTKKCVLFHHGHYFEELYSLMTALSDLFFPERQKPEYPWDIERENFAWIDFFWSVMGRSGDVGRNVELFYEKMHNTEALKKFLARFAEELAKKYDLPGWGDIMEAKFLKWGINMLVDRFSRLERSQTETALSKSTETGLRKYLDGPLYRQILTENARVLEYDVACVFGHTHKPLQDDMDFNQYPLWVDVYNTGGWVVDTEEPSSVHGGAVVLVDEELNLASLRMYNEQQDQNDYAVRVEEASQGHKPNKLHASLKALIKPNQNPWKRFSLQAARAVNVRRKHLRARIRQ